MALIGPVKELAVQKFQRLGFRIQHYSRVANDLGGGQAQGSKGYD